MIVILTEKPKVISKIANFLSNKKEIVNTEPLTVKIYVDGEEIIIISAVGHLLNLETNEKGYPVFKTYWSPIRGYQEKYLKNACYWLKKADKIYIATDYDIEGELIAYNILKYCNVLNKKIFRMKFSSLTKEEIIKAFNNPIKLNKNLIEAGETRHLIDWIYGINLSRALMESYYKFTKKRESLSIGRVQGAILRLIYDREKEIENFKSKYFWVLKAKDIDKNVIFVGKKFENEKEAKEVYNKIKDKKGKIIKIELKNEKINPFPNFNLPDLQEEAYKLFKIQPSETLRILQNLYENGYISYPRTSSQKLPENNVYLNNILINLSVLYPEAKKFLNKKPLQGKKDDPAHPAIHPTGVIPKNLNKKEKIIYELIVKRFLSSFSESAELLVQNVYLKVGEEIFKYTGKKIIKGGFLHIYNFYKIEETFVEYKENQEVNTKIVVEKNKTKPPSRYNQGQIIKVLEQKKIGTKATRAQILELLYKRGYIEGETIKLTSLGKKIVEIMIKYSPKIVDLNMTKDLEESLEKIIEGKENSREILKKNISLISNISRYLKTKEEEIGKELKEEKEKAEKEILENKKVADCKCGGLLIVKEGKKGKFLGCTNWPECNITYSLPEYKRILKSKCKNCGARLFLLKNNKKYCVICKETKN